MSAYLRLDRPTRLFLRRVDRKTRDADLRVRCRILLKVHGGLNRNAAAREIGCVPSTAWRVVARFLEIGIAALFDGRKENGARKVDDRVRSGITQILAGGPQDYGYSRTNWTLELLRKVIAQELATDISVGHLWKLLRAMKIRWGMAKPIVACPWPAEKRERRFRQLRRLARDPGRRQAVLFADEVDIDLNPRIGRDWMLPGTQRLILTPGKNQKSYLAGAFDPNRHRMVCVDGPKKATWLFLNLLRAVLDVYPWASRIHIILDNYIIHKSAIVQAWLQTVGRRIQLHFLPPYCPDENKIERIWRDLHANVTRNHRCSSLRELLDQAWDYLAAGFETYAGLCLSSR